MSWSLLQLKDVCSLLTDGTHYTPPNIGKGIPFLTVKDVSDSGLDFKGCSRITLEEYNKADAGNSAPKVGDVLFSKDGTVGKVHVVKEVEPFAVLSSLAILRPKESLDSDYLGHVLKSPLTLRQAAKNKTGSALRRIILSDIKKLEIPLPPLAEQQRIAAILDKADAIRRKRQQAIQLADEFLRVVFLDMFGDPATNPKGWEVKKWQDVLTIINGKNQKKVEDNNGAYSIYGSGGKMGRASDYLCRENSIIIGRKGNINKPILVREKFWNVDTAFGLEAKKEFLSFQYLYWFCKFFNFEKLNKTVTIPSLTKADLLNIEIPMPPVILQMKFEKVCNKIELQNIRTQSQEVKVKDLFSSLSQKAFAGNL
jgi:type I restriction enzyme S subunit